MTCIINCDPGRRSLNPLRDVTRHLSQLERDYVSDNWACSACSTCCRPFITFKGTVFIASLSTESDLTASSGGLS